MTREEFPMMQYFKIKRTCKLPLMAWSILFEQTFLKLTLTYSATREEHTFEANGSLHLTRKETLSPALESRKLFVRTDHLWQK